MSKSRQRLASLIQDMDADGVILALFDSHPLPMVVLDPASRGVVAFNAAALALYGYPEDEALALDVTQLRPLQDRGELVQRLQDLGNAPARQVRAVHIKRDGTTFPVEVTSHHVTLGHKALRLISIQDVTEDARKAAAARSQQELHEHLQQAQSDLGHAQGLIDMTSGRLLHVNEAMERITGRTAAELLAMKTGLDMVATSDRDAIRARMAERLAGGSPPARYEAMVLHKSGRVVPVEVNIKRLPEARALFLVQDLTERKRSEQAFLNQQKMESLAVLAGGVAHDFNNLMAIILGNVDMASREVPLDSPVREWLRSIETAGMRAADIGQQMLAYSGKGHFVVTRVDLNRLLMDMDDILHITAGRQARMEVVPGNPCHLDADQSQMRQLVMNLVANAVEATTAGTGVVTVQTHVILADSARLAAMVLGEGRTPGPYVSLQVTDNGAGMDAQTLQRIFDPFFTTRFTGRGLGLSAVLGIVRGHKGAIRVNSQPGKGTTVDVLLPSASGAELALDIPVHTPVPVGDERPLVLVADDEEGVRSVVAKILERSGYEVITAADGQEAVDLFRRHAARVSAVVLDMTMPVLSGEDTLAEMRMLRPEARVLLMSGFNEDEARIRFRADGSLAFIRKPFMPDELRERVRKMLTG